MSFKLSKIGRKELLDYGFVILINVLIILFFVLIPFSGVTPCGNYIHYMVVKGQIGQWLQFAFYLISSIILFVRFRYHHGKMAFITFSFASLSLFIAMEEIQWGHYIFNYTHPFVEMVRGHNLEGKFELHNMIPLVGNNWVYIIFSLGIIVIAPLVEHFVFKQDYGYFANTKVRWIYLELLPFYCVMVRAAKQYNELYIYFYEYTELFVALSFFVLAVGPLSKYTKRLL